MQPLNAFTEQYIETLLWSEIDEDGAPLDDDYGPEDIAPGALAEIRQDCAAFFEANQLAINDAPDWYDYEQAGHDFALTRNGHGAGFWDRGLRELGEQLTAAADAYGEQHLYIGDDGQLHV